MRLNIGYIGNGKSANRYHIPFALCRPDKFNVAKIWSVHPEADPWPRVPGAAYTSDLDELLGDPDIDVVEVCSPSSFHVENARAVLEAGKHVTVDKPFAATVAQAEELFALAEEKGVTIQCYQQRRFDSDFVTAKRVMESGRLGRVFEIVTSYDYWRPHMMDGMGLHPVDNAGFGHGSHCIDQLVSWLGVPDRWSSELRQLNGPDAANDYFDVDLYYDDRNLKATAHANYDMAFDRPSFAVYGDRGAYVKWGKDQQERDLKHFYMPLGHDDFGLDEARDYGTLRYEDETGFHEERVVSERTCYSLFYDALYETVANGAECLVRPEETLAQLRILEDGMNALLARNSVAG